MKRRVVVTGLGLVTPVGHNVPETWENILAGKSGVSLVDLFDTSAFASRIGGVVRDFDVTAYLSRKEMRKMDPFIQYGIAASVQAIQDSGLTVTDDNRDRIGIAIGSGIGGLPGIEKNYEAYITGGPHKISPFLIPSAIINMVAGNLSIMYGMRGPNYGIVSACTTGAHNIGDAARMVERGDVDTMVAGGTEMATCPLGLGGFAAARALSTRNDDPQRASRPWDKDRDGFVLADGAGVMVLEAYETARARGAEIYAELVGYGKNSDAYHMTLPSPDARGAARCMALALTDARCNPDEIHYINAHGTSTPAGDVAESNAIKHAFGEHAYRLAVSSTKSMVGHMLGAAGSVEAIFCVLSLRDQVVPPTINLYRQEDGCDLDYVPHEARKMKVDVVLSNSFGFGGTNATLIFRRLS